MERMEAYVLLCFLLTGHFHLAHFYEIIITTTIAAALANRSEQCVTDKEKRKYETSRKKVKRNAKKNGHSVSCNYRLCHIDRAINYCSFCREFYVFVVWSSLCVRCQITFASTLPRLALCLSCCVLAVRLYIKDGFNVTFKIA